MRAGLQARWDFVAVCGSGEEDHVGRVHDVEVADEAAQLGSLDASQIPVDEGDARRLFGEQGLERLLPVGGLADAHAERLQRSGQAEAGRLPTVRDEHIHAGPSLLLGPVPTGRLSVLHN